MNPFEVDVLCVGHAAYDLTMTVDRHPLPDEKAFALDLVSCGGGPAANASVTVARLGGKSAFAGYLGSDLYGERHWSELRAVGVRTDLVIRGEHPTPLSIILAKPDGARTVVNYKGRTPLLLESQVDFSLCRPRVVLFDGHEPLISAHPARAAKAKGIPMILDAGSVHRGTLELAPMVDIVAASARFAREFTGLVDPLMALEAMGEQFPVVVMTLGRDGLLWKRGREQGALPAFRVETVDTTGAGDTFHGALALGLAREMEFQDLLRMASAAAALCCTKLGARIGIPTEGELQDFLRKQS